MTGLRASVAAYYQRRRERPKRHTRETYTRADIFARWGGCCYCDSPAEVLDHVDPISRGGVDALQNIVPACAACNGSKAALALAEWAETF